MNNNPMECMQDEGVNPMSKNTTSVKNATEFLKLCESNEIEFVDFVFTDARGKLQHTTYITSFVDKDLLNDGFYFDGSSIAGWCEIHQSDMLLKPDLSRIALDPFTAQPTLIVFCDVYDPTSGDSYNRCPRNIAKAAEEYVKSTGIADTVYFGPEAEFFIFDDVRYKSDMFESSYRIDSRESPNNTDRDYGTDGNTGHRPGVKGGYFPVAPVDSGQDIRSEMLSVLDSVGVIVQKHHHEVAPSQGELGIEFDTLLKCADNMQLYKYIIHNVAHAFGQTATFMPKPVAGDNGSGMHCHQSLFNGKDPLFAGDLYANLSQECLWYIGGIIKHAKALNAFTNPSTNSYKRLVPGYEAPVLLAYSARNRSASCRIPMATSPKARRVEVRFPDPMANPYLAFAAQLMAGLDGIQNKIEPGVALDKNLYDLPASELADIPTVARSLREALDSLKADHDFLLQGDVFTADMIEGYIDLKMEEVERFEMAPHPVEFDMYYSS
jgi:glutamine synthetase